MQHQQIPGLLHWVTMEHEGDMTFWYQITGLQSLSDWLCHHPLNYVLFEHLLGGLLALQEELPRFYLKSEHLLLGAEQIFLDTSGKQVVFCYEPLWQKEPQESLRNLMEHLLPLVDHDDQDAVRLAYGLYEKCQEPNADIWQYVLEQAGSKKNFEQRSEAWDAQLQSEKVSERVEGQTASPMKVSSTKDLETLQKKMRGKLPSISALAWLEGLWKKKKEETMEPVYLFEPEQESAVSAHPTVFLGTVETAEGRLLYQGTGAEKSFLIEGDTFLVGGRNEQADGKLLSSGVSRNHARITREENNFYIEDLNSRNGTYLNGKLLAYKQKCQVKPGDHLKFAREEYVFY